MDVTEKQKEFIDIICRVLDIEFEGKTKEDATKFISENIREFNLEQAKAQIIYESHGFL